MNVSDPKCRDVASLRELWDCRKPLLIASWCSL